MKNKRSNRGSALLISLVVVIIAVGIGGAFLSQTLYHAKEQSWAIEADEAMTMCDAGMERARQALGVYKGTLWNWNNLATYCANSPTDGMLIKQQAMAFMASSTYQGYTKLLWTSSSGTTQQTTGTRVGSTSNTADNTDPTTLLPMNQTIPTPSADQNKVLFGWPIAFNRGVLFMTATVPGGAIPGTEPTNLLVRVTAILPSGLVRQVEGLVEKPNPTPLKANGLAAVVSNDQVSVNGNTMIDGQDYNYTGTKVVGTGVPGVLSVSAINVGGSAGIGGKGAFAPSKGAATESLATNYVFQNGYPPDPDTSLNLAPGTLKAYAQANGTYVQDAAGFSALLSANGGHLPNHAIIYADFNPGNGSMDIGSGNSLASILIFHTDQTTATVSELHGSFTGLMLADAIDHVNAGTSIIGEVQMFSPTASTAGNVFGNGTSTIKFSSAVLGDLPGLSAGGSPATLSAYRRVQ